MEKLQDFPFFPIEFAKDGSQAQPAQLADVLADLRTQPGLTDLIVISHGWNNDMADARDRYSRFLAEVRPQLTGPAARPGLAGRQFGVVGVLWPSKKFADAALIPSGAAGTDSPVTNAMLVAELERLKGAFDQPGADDLLDPSDHRASDPPDL